MKIIGIDPGYERMGVAIIEKIGNEKETVVFSTCIRTSSKENISERLHQIGENLSLIIDRWKPDEAAIEDLYFAKNTKTALSVAEARGVIQYVIAQKNLPCCSYHPNAIKIAITGYGGAKKEDIAFMLPKLVAYDTAKKIDDELDAIAVALTHLAHVRLNYPQYRV